MVAMRKLLRRCHAGRGRDEGGFVLITTFMIIAVFVTLTISLMSYAMVDLQTGQREQAWLQGFYLAEGAVDQGLAWLRSQPAPPGGTSASTPLGGYTAPDANGGSSLFTLRPDNQNMNAFLKRYTLSGQGVVGPLAGPTAVVNTSLIVQTASFARYAYFTNNERSPSGQSVWFVTGDHITGPMHTNDQFHIAGSPIYDGPVTSVASTWIRYNAQTNPLFNQGFTGGVPTVQYPNSFPPALTTAASNGGVSLTGDTTVALASNGTMTVTNLAKGWVNQVMPVPTNGAFYVSNGNLAVSGTLKGQLTLASTGDIQVTNSVKYSDDPRINPNSTDILGLLAGGNVTIMQSAPTDVEVDASIMALNTSFIVQNYSAISLRGNLTVYGGIIQANRGPVGTFGSTGVRNHGYAKDYHWDPRFAATVSPPYFPTTGDYVIVAWQNQ